MVVCLSRLYISHPNHQPKHHPEIPIHRIITIMKNWAANAVGHGCGRSEHTKCTSGQLLTCAERWQRHRGRLVLRQRGGCSQWGWLYPSFVENMNRRVGKAPQKPNVTMKPIPPDRTHPLQTESIATGGSGDPKAGTKKAFWKYIPTPGGDTNLEEAWSIETPPPKKKVYHLAPQ